MAITFSETIQVCHVPILRGSIIDRLFYQEEEIANFKYQAFLEECGIVDMAELDVVASQDKADEQTRSKDVDPSADNELQKSASHLDLPRQKRELRAERRNSLRPSKNPKAPFANTYQIATPTELARASSYSRSAAHGYGRPTDMLPLVPRKSPHMRIC